VGANTHTPAEVPNRVVSAGLPSVAHSLKGVTGNGAKRGSSIASAHKDRICSVAKVVDAKLCAGLMRADTVAGRCRKTKTRCCKSIRESFVSDRRESVGQTKQGADNAT